MNTDNKYYTNLKEITDIYSRIIETEVYQSEENYHFEILLLVDKNKGLITRKKLAKLSRINLAHFNSIIYYLQAEGLVTMVINDADSNDPAVLLTSKGAESIDRINLAVIGLNNKIIASLNTDEVLAFNKTIEKLKLILKRELLTTSSIMRQ